MGGSSGFALVSNRPPASAKRSRFIVLAGTLKMNIATSTWAPFKVKNFAILNRKKFLKSTYLNKYSSYTNEIFSQFYLSVVSARSNFFYFFNFRIFFIIYKKPSKKLELRFSTPLKTNIEACNSPVNLLFCLNVYIQINFQSFWSRYNHIYYEKLININSHIKKSSAVSHRNYIFYVRSHKKWTCNFDGKLMQNKRF